MDNVVIRDLNTDEELPYALLLLADPSLEMINAYCSKGICRVAFVDGNLAGAIVFTRKGPLTWEIVNIAVDERYQGQGIGKRLIRDIVDRARKEKAGVLEVGTGNSSIDQLAFYQKCGFRITGIIKDYFKKHYQEKIVENGIECLDMIRLSMDLSVVKGGRAKE